MTDDTITIPRTGKPSLQLRGWQSVARSSSQAEQGPCSHRWHELELLRDAEATLYCVAIHYRTTWDGESSHDAAYFASREGIAATLTTHDPCVAVYGYPEGPQFADRQDRLLRALRDGYAHAVSALLDAAGIYETGPEVQS